MKAFAHPRISFHLLVALFCGCATADRYDIRPDVGDDKTPTGVEWQTQNDAWLAAATKPSELSRFVASPAAADALLAQIGAAYKGDPKALTLIGCVTQFVMDPSNDNRMAQRALWVSALERTKTASKDSYVKTFCEQQLWQCRPVGK